MDYGPTLLSLQDGMQNYFKTYVDSLNKINTDYNYGILQLAITERSYTAGVLSEYTQDKKETNLFGKSNQFQKFVVNLIRDVRKDIEQNNDPIFEFLKLKGVTYTGKQKRELEEKLQAIVSERQNAILDIITNNTSNITNIQNDLNFIFRQLDVVASKLDGELGSNNEPVLYDLSGDTFFAPSTTDGSLANVYVKRVPEAIAKFENLLEEQKIVSKTWGYKENSSTIENGTGCSFRINNVPYFGAGNGNCAFNRFYIAMSPLFTNSGKLTELKNNLTSGNEIKTSPTLVKGINDACDATRDEYQKFQDEWTKAFDNVLKSPVYEEVSKFKLPDNQVKICQYVTPATNDINQKNKRIKDLYSNQNLNDKKDTFNGKVTLN